MFNSIESIHLHPLIRGRVTEVAVPAGIGKPPKGCDQLLTLSLRETPATLLRKPISAACIRDLVLSVMTHP